MRILLMDPDTNSARELHTKLLTYKGVYWDLEHFDSPEAATASLLRDAFDVALIRLRGNETIEGQLQNFLEASRTLPMVALIDSEHAHFELQWIRLGFSDVVINENLTPDLIMRRLRLAVARLERQIQDIQTAKTRLQFAVNVGAHSETEGDQAVSAQSKQIDREIDFADKKKIAILRDHGTPRLLEGADDEVEVEVFRDLKSYVQAVSHRPTFFDLALVEQDLLEREGNRAFEHAELHFPAPPLVLVSSDRSDAAAVAQIADGFDDCVHARSCTTSSLLRTVQLCVSRWDVARQQVRQSLLNAPVAPDRRQSARSGRDRRVGSRYLVTKPLLAIPVLADGCPDRSNIRDAFSIDMAMGGLGFQISNHSGIPGRNWVIGVETDLGDGLGERFHYCHVVVRNVSYPQGGVRMGAQFQPASSDILHPNNLMPTLNVENGCYEHRLSERALQQWIELGVLRPKMLHRVNSCPECSAVSTVGRGCHECGSPDIRFKELIHHFACAAVDDSRRFQRDRDLCCRKCFAESLVVGVDFELIQSHYQCCDCQHEGSQIADVFTCIKCRLRFPGNLAVEEEVYSYDVDRLDILALLNTAD
ncbi:MAG: hypothetical protein U0930_10115 [Pirellulales bacterium]